MRADGPRQVHESLQLLPEDALLQIYMGPIEPQGAHGSVVELSVIDDGVRVVMVSHAGLEIFEDSLFHGPFLFGKVYLCNARTLSSVCRFHLSGRSDDNGSNFPPLAAATLSLAILSQPGHGLIPCWPKALSSSLKAQKSHIVL